MAVTLKAKNINEALDFRGTSVDFTSAAHDSVLKIETVEVEVDGGLVTYEAGEGARVEIGSAKNADGSLVSIPEYNPNSTVFKSGTKLYLRAYIMDNWLNIYTIDQVTVNGTPVTLDADGAYQFTVEDGGVQIVVTTKAVEYNLSYTASGNETCVFYDEEGNPISEINDVTHTGGEAAVYKVTSSSSYEKSPRNLGDSSFRFFTSLSLLHLLHLTQSADYCFRKYAQRAG